MTRSLQLSILLLAGVGAQTTLVPLKAARSQTTVGASVHSPPQGVITGNTPAASASPLGLALADVNGRLMVTGVSTTGPFAGFGLRVGDQITGLNGRAVLTAAELFNRLFAAGNTGQAATASLDISRNGRPLVLNVPNASLSRIAQVESQLGLGGSNGLQTNANLNGTGLTDTTGSADLTGQTGTASLNNGVMNSTTAANVIRESLLQRSALGAQQALSTQNLPSTFDPINSTGTTNPISSTGTTNPINSTGTTNPLNTTGTTNPINSTGTTNPINDTGTTNPINSTGTTNPINSTGTTNPINSTGTTNPAISAGTTNQLNTSGATTGATQTTGSGITSGAGITSSTTTTDDQTSGATPINPLVQQAMDQRAALNSSRGGFLTPGSTAGAAAAASAGSTALPASGVTTTTEQTGGGQTGAAVPVNPLVQQAMEARTAQNSGRGFLTPGARSATPATPATPAIPGVSPGIPATPATPAAPATERSGQNATQRTSEATEQQNLPTTVLTPSGPRISMPGERLGQGRGATGVPTVPGARAGAAGKNGGSGGKGTSRPAAGARPNGGGGASGVKGAGS